MGDKELASGRTTYSELRTYDWNPESGLYTSAHKVIIPPNQGIIISRGRHPELVAKGEFLQAHDARRHRKQFKLGAYHTSKSQAVLVLPEDGVITAFSVGERAEDYPANGTHVVDAETRELIFVAVGVDKEVTLRQITNWEQTIPLQRTKIK